MAKIHLSKVDTHIDKQLVFKAGDIEKLVGKRSHVKYLIKENRIVSLGSGYYSTPRLSRFDSLILILQKYFPKAIISGSSALYIHGIISKPEDKIDADIVNTTSQRSHLFDFSRVAVSRMSHSEVKEFHGKHIRVYEPERALADLILKKVSPQLIKTALLGYINYPHKNYSRVTELDALLGTDLRKRLDMLFLKINYNPNSVRSDRQTLLETAISLYAYNGSANISIKNLAKESALSIKRVSSVFKSKSAVIRAVFESVESKVLRTKVTTSFPKNAQNSRDWVFSFMDSCIKIIHEDPITFRIQRWGTTEQLPQAASIIKIWNDLIQRVAVIVKQEVPHIGTEAALARSLMFFSLLDQYGTLRWYMTCHLTLEVDKGSLLQDYKKELREQMDAMLFKPVKASKT